LQEEGDGSLGRELDRVVDEMDEDLPEAERVTGDEELAGKLRLEAEIDFLFLGPGLEEPEYFVRDLRRREGQPFEHEPAFLNFREIEQIVDERTEPPAFTRDGGDVTALGVVEL
jgi:hypothetical protein